MLSEDCTMPFSLSSERKTSSIRISTCGGAGFILDLQGTPLLSLASPCCGARFTIMGRRETFFCQDCYGDWSLTYPSGNLTLKTGFVAEHLSLSALVEPFTDSPSRRTSWLQSSPSAFACS